MPSDILTRLREATKKQTKRRGPPCSVCSLKHKHHDVLKAIHALLDEGMGKAEIVRGVKAEFGILLTNNRLVAHCRDEHTAAGENG